jgi:hypothetical protein
MLGNRQGTVLEQVIYHGKREHDQGRTACQATAYGFSRQIVKFNTLAKLTHAK